MSSSRSSSQYGRDTWVPGQAVLQPTIGHDAKVEDMDLDSMDEHPIIYFLTPAPSSYCDDSAMDFDMEFDAGIEDAKHSPQVVRSVSPSSLGGFSRPPLHPPTPPRSPATPDLESDLSATPDDNEQYDYMVPSWPPRPANPPGLPHHLKKDKFRGAPKQDDRKTHGLSPLSSTRSLRDSTRGRAVTKSGAKPSSASTGSSAARMRRPPGTPARLSAHAWREPSPDVWSIEEEPEQEPHNEVKDGSATRYGTTTRAVDIPAAKPKKKVRFVLPAMDDDDDGRGVQH
ncbi:uncharacterized protein B0T15DRAFT_102684 [Chaetomium strumarium]|uniref:Uncharacterized protein n=1 Tax=Chaetomium strumarium TaxID=1170767 RepID=A0AAJ0GYT5_9PEZI|nr:hypothetical protein B0T15DRAFT_102684 [Chaetomium strumarium]